MNPLIVGAIVNGFKAGPELDGMSGLFKGLEGGEVRALGLYPPLVYIKPLM
jgi:hypothetical protein